MKKFLSIFLTVVLVLALTAVAVSAATIAQDDKEIFYTNLLDFNKETNELWAEYDEAEGKWVGKLDPEDSYCQPVDEESGMPIAPVLIPYSSYSAHKWSLIEDGEVLHFESTDASIYPGIAFALDQAHDSIMPIGAESSKKAEYVKIRIRNHSVCDQMSFGFVTSNTNNGRFVNEVVSHLTEDADGKKYESSGEWVTYTFSMPTINMNTNYGEKEDFKGRWGASLYEFLIFPFGYDITDGTGNYPGAAMDIDYIVIGSRDYVDNYKSALEIKEEKIASLELITAPTKNKYYVGDALDLDGLQLKATYTDNAEGEILTTASASVSTFVRVENEVTLKFGSKSVSFPVEVVDITGIEVIATPEDNVFEVDELADGFVSDGYEIKVTYADGTTRISSVTPDETKTLANSSFKFQGDYTTTGTKNVDVYYFGKSTSFEIKTIQISDIKLTPKKEYRYGDTVALGDFDISFVFDDGSERAVAEADVADFFEERSIECDVKTPGTAKAKLVAKDNTYTITIEKEIDVTVETPTDIEVTTDDKTWKSEYNPGDTFDATGLTVSLVYGEGENATKVAMNAADYTTRVNLGSAGKKSVQIRSEVPGLKEIFEDIKPKASVTVLGASGGDSSSSSSSSSAPATNPPAGGDNGWVLPVIIVAAILVVGAVVVVVIVVVKKKKQNN